MPLRLHAQRQPLQQRGLDCRWVTTRRAPPATRGRRGLGIGVQPNASGLDVSADGKTLVVANNYNDSISVIDTATRTRPLRARPAAVLRRQRRTRRRGRAARFPFAVVMKGNGVAYVSSDRDREVVVD